MVAIIEVYDFGVMVINGKKYTSDLIIAPGKIVENWWRVEGHSLCLKDLEEVLDEKFEYLVVGTGYYGLMKVKREVYEEMGKRGVKILAKPTREAVNEFNKLVKEGRSVVGAFHLTC